jgi:hypothetical protein
VLPISPDRTDYREFFDERSLAEFNRIYAKDIQAWGYDFETGKRVAP